jgi:cyclase
MYKIRVIPCLLLKGKGLIKTVKFKNETYVGDPINAIRIFNEKEVDELILIDIESTTAHKPIPLNIISDVASECFMPLCYGGGIRNITDIKNILALGVEKIAINSMAIENPSFVKAASEAFGSQSIVVSIDVKGNSSGKYEVFTYGGKKSTKLDPVQVAINMERMGAGEILLTSIDRDGTMQGYDIEILKQVSEAVTIPVIALGGAGKLAHLKEAIESGGASAVAAGSFFIFHGKYRAVLISYPSVQEIDNMLL